MARGIVPPKSPGLAPPRPWAVAPRVGSLIPIRTTREPIVDVCFVAINGNLLEAEDTADLIVWWSEQDAINNRLA